MDILEYAKEIETKGEQLYREMASRTPISEIKSIFGFLAEEEKRHFEYLVALGHQKVLPQIAESTILVDAQEEFRNLSDQFTTPGAIAIDREFALDTALEFENKSISLYDSALDELLKDPKNASACMVLKIIVEQEKKHVQLVKSLMEFQRHPYEWLENAEWNHLDTF